MPIPVVCPGCAKRFNAPDRGAGKKVPCPQCKTTIQIPLLASDPDDDYRLEAEPARPVPEVITPQPGQVRPLTPPKLPASQNPFTDRGAKKPPEPEPSPEPPAPYTPSQVPPRPAAWVPKTQSSVPTWLRHLHWLLALAMIPLALSIVIPSTPTIPIKTDPETGEKSIDLQLLNLPEEASEVEQIAALQSYLAANAFLSADSKLHWVFAFISAAAFMTFFIFLASDKCAHPLHLLGVGLFTATIGIALLLAVQTLAAIGGGFRLRGGGIIALIFLVLLLIGLSYSMALNPDVGFIGSFFGFTCGVGLCEELCKAAPILVFYHIGNKQNWRGAFLWGLASGCGFGVSEGIMYSADFYNGVMGSWIYLVRFASCVALHAIWAGSIGISINQRRDLLEDEHEEWYEYVLNVLRLILIPMVLHGLYDTLLKKDMEFFALVTAAASFGYLAWQISHLRRSDDDDERAKFVRDYIKARAATT